MSLFPSTDSRGVTAIGTPKDTCATTNGIIILTNRTTTECMIQTNGQGVPQTSSCPSSVNGASSIFCLSDLCFISTPSVGVVAMNISGMIHTFFQ